MRKLLIAIFTLVVVVTLSICVAAVRLRAGVSALAPEVARRLSERLGVTIEHGDVSLSLLPLAARIQDVRVAAKPRTRPFLMARSFDATAELLPLLWGHVDIRRVVADGLRVEMLSDREVTGVTSVPPGFVAALADLPFALELRDGSVLIQDRSGEPATRILVERITGTARGGVDGTLDLDLDGAALGRESKGALSLRLKPAVGPTGGDHVTLKLDIHDGDAAMLREAFPMLHDADVRGPVEISLSADGLFGEKSTESLPAQPLTGKLAGSLGVVIAGLEDRLSLDLDLALDDTRYLVKGGKGTWAGLRLQPTGWIMRKSPRKVSGRVEIEPFDLAEISTRFGLPEQWRPRGRPNLSLQLLGTSVEPLCRYEATIPELSLDAWSALPIRGEDVSVRGTLAAVNADASGSFKVQNLRLGTARIPAVSFGVTYWRDKLSVTSLKLPTYQGELNGGMTWWPRTADAPTGGLAISDADAPTVLANIFPRLGLTIEGRLDANAQIGADDQGYFVRGRIGIHRGRIDGANWARDLLRATIAAPSVVEAASSVHPGLLATEVTRFERLAVDFETRGGSVTLPRLVIDMKGGSFRGRGDIREDGTLSLSAALWPDAEVASTLEHAAASSVGRARDAEGRMVFPGEIHAAAGRIVVEPTPALLAAVRGEGTPQPLDPPRVSVAELGGVARLREQFGR